MADVVVSEFVTADGVMQSPGPETGFAHAGWAFEFDRGAEGDAFKFDELMAAGVLLLGRVTYERFAEAWPTMEGTGEFGEKMNAMPKHVVSSTLQRAEWNNSRIVGGDLAAAIGELKRDSDGDILVNGSAQLVQSLIEHDLIDEYRLMVFPIILGSGKRLFADTCTKATLELVDAIRAGDTVVLTYRPLRARATA
jgi:dihydrofolate reductase